MHFPSQMTTMNPLKLRMPDRYEMIVRLSKNGEVRNIVIDVPDGLSVIDRLYEEMESTGRGSFLALYGKPGSGKSTLLNTVPLFREGVEVVPIEPRESIPDVLDGFKPFPGRLRIVIIKAREALANTAKEEIEAALLAINNFLRSAEGSNTLVAWPCSLPALRDCLVEAALGIGGPSLLGTGAAVNYEGPPKEQFLPIARSTIATFNAGATLIDWGITEAWARKLAEQADTIGTFLQRLGQEARSRLSTLISKLPERERFRLWIVVAAGNDPESDINALTRGAYYHVDIERLLVSTDANISQELREDQARVGLLGTLFDARLLLLPMRTAMAIVEEFALPALRAELAARAFQSPGRSDGQSLLMESDLARAFQEEPAGKKRAGKRPGPQTQDRARLEFEKLTELASEQDGLLNSAIGACLQASGLVISHRRESPTGGRQRRYSDLLCETTGGLIRLEMMWCAQTSRGEIANYVLKKLAAYGKAIGYLST